MKKLLVLLIGRHEITPYGAIITFGPMGRFEASDWFLANNVIKQN